MFRLLVVSIAISYCSAVPAYGGMGGIGGLGALGGGIALGGYGGLSLGGGYGGDYGGLSYGGGLGLSSYAGPQQAAIQTHRSYEVIPVATHNEPAVPQIIDVGPSEQPVQVIFRTVSSPVLVQQIHTPGEPGHTEATRSEDEPHRVLHEVLRPVIQEVREVIQPYRRVTQEVRPVLEEVHTLVAKGERHGGALLAGDAGLAIDGGYNGLNGGGLSAGYGGKSYKAGAKKAA